MSERLALPDVTLCAVASVNLAASLAAMKRCLAVANFGKALLFTDAEIPDLPQGIEKVAIPRVGSSSEYSRFVLRDLADWVGTSHCLIVQWDGFILNPSAWDEAFLACDYIGAPWPQFGDGHDVGNGGFSLRSKRLMLAARDPQFVHSDAAEDLVIARINRPLLEQGKGLRFADRAAASAFAFERDRDVAAPFGFHGVFNLPEAVGVDGFWHIYASLDDKRTVWTDFWPLLRAVARGPKGIRRALKLASDRIGLSR
ncbi:DUF5672 family protein [Porphyrobacter sp. AAP60]|uniref:DUF5672 family protein n=1 Tax=Porphyrobacter sp. AAP60 TaxID=1523423 RepID=UPI000A7C626C|nr:DUF5672 family protein [Porphyrobacter sp. AAP60]